MRKMYRNVLYAWSASFVCCRSAGGRFWTEGEEKKKGIFQSAVMIVGSPFLFDVVEFGGSDSSTPTPRLLHLCLSGCCALVCIFVYA